MSPNAPRSGVTGRAFRALWLGQTVSALGTQVSLVALPLVAVLVLHVGPLELGVLAALETLPYLVLALPAGVFVDRADRRWTMIACDLGRAVVLLGTALAIAHGRGLDRAAVRRRAGGRLVERVLLGGLQHLRAVHPRAAVSW